MRPAPATSSPRCCPSSERVLGAEHPYALTARAHLARWTGAAGDAAAAHDQFAALLPVYERVWPRAPVHPVRPRQPRPLDRGGGDAAAARDQYAALLPIQERVPGPEHPHTLTARARPGPLDRGGGDAAGARDQFAALLPVPSGSWAPSTRTPSPPAPTSPIGQGRRTVTRTLGE